MATIKFIQLSQSKYDAFASDSSLSASSIYFTSDTRRIYKGDTLYSNEIVYLTLIPTTVEGLDTDKLYVVITTGDMFVNYNGLLKQVGSDSNKTEEFLNNFSSVSSDLDLLDIRLTSAESDIIELGNTKLDNIDFNSYSSATSETLASIANDIDTLTSDSSVTMSSAAGENNTLQVYTFMQGGREIGKVNIPKDLVVSEGSVVKGTWTNDVFTLDVQGNGTALKLIIANQTSPVYINTLDLVKDHTGSTVNGITVNISANNVISVSIADGTIQSSTLASDVQNSLTKADTALQSGATYYTDIKVDANGDTLAVDMNSVKGRIDALEGFNSSSLSAMIDGQIDAKIDELDSSASAQSGSFINSITMQNGKITSIGLVELGTAAFTDSTEYDPSGSAEAMGNSLMGSSSDSVGTLTIHGLANSIAELGSSTSDSVSTLESSMSDFVTNSIIDSLTWEEVED